MTRGCEFLLQISAHYRRGIFGHLDQETRLTAIVFAAGLFEAGNNPIETHSDGSIFSLLIIPGSSPATHDILAGACFFGIEYPTSVPPCDLGRSRPFLK